MYFISRFFDYILQLFFQILPDTRCYHFKSFILRCRGYNILSSVRIVSSVRLKIENLSIGEASFLGHEVMIVGGGSVSIGKNVDIAPRCIIVTGSHKIGPPTRRAGEGFSEDIVINDGVWVGTGAIILGGTHIGEGTVVAAGTLLKGNYPANVLLAGIPAQIKKQY